MKYYRPDTIDELQETLDEVKASSMTILAGGTDVIPRWQDDATLMPEVLVDIKKIDDFEGISQSEKEIKIGSLTSIQDIKNSPIIQKEFTALSDAASEFGGVQIRHRATLGGNICNASPAGDLLPGLYAHHAELTLVGPKGERSMSISEFIIGVGKTALEPGEVLSEIRLERKKEKSIFYKLGLRQSMAISVVDFAIVYEKGSDGQFKSLNIAAGSVAPTIVYLKSFTNAILNGKSLDESVDLVDRDISPIDDIRASADYRRAALKNVLHHTVKQELGKSSV